MSKPPEDEAPIVVRVGDRVHQAMARGRVALDENAAMLFDALRAANFQVESVDSGNSDARIMQTMKSSIIVTKNTRDFIQGAREQGFGIISLEDVFLDTDASRNNKTVKLIEAAIKKHGLWARQGGWVAKLRTTGPAVVQTLTKRR